MSLIRRRLPDPSYFFCRACHRHLDPKDRQWCGQCRKRALEMAGSVFRPSIWTRIKWWWQGVMHRHL